MKKVLICDDSRVSALAIQHFMTQNGVYIEGTVFGQKDFEKLIETSDKPDFVTMDMILPDGDGVQCCKKLWAKWPKIPVIFFTDAEIKSELRAQLPHVKMYITKPIINKKIVDALKLI